MSQTQTSLLEILDEILKTKPLKEISIKLNIAVGTIRRWIELKNIPDAYRFELMKLANIDIDYSLFSFKDKDQFFTPSITAEYCYSKCKEILKKYGDNYKKYIFIEPSAGSGNFLKLLPLNKRIGLDIESKNPEIIQADYLTWSPDVTGKFIVIGNPPFGLRGQMALKFINHSSVFADYVCFILPQLFESDGKGVPRKRIIGLNLIHSEKLKTSFEYPNGKDIKIECIYQIWSKYHYDEKYEIEKISNPDISVYSLSDGKNSSQIRNKKMFGKCDIYIPSTCFGKDNMKYYDFFYDLPQKKGYGIVFNKNKNNNIKKFKAIDWSNIAFLSTNSAYNIRKSQIIKQFI